jgi:hypothetical protein
MHCYAHAALGHSQKKPYLTPEVAVEGTARTPNLTPFIISKQRRIEIPQGNHPLSVSVQQKQD